MLHMGDSEEPPTPDDHSATPSGPKSGSRAPTPSVNTPEPTATRSSDSSQEEVTESDRREARQLLCQEGAMRKTGWLLLRTNAENLRTVAKQVGTRHLHVEQLFDWNFSPRSYPLAFLLVYKWSPDRGDRVKWNPQHQPGSFAEMYEDDSGSVGMEDIMFCGHMMDNASVTQGLINALINIRESSAGQSIEMDDGSKGVLQDFDIGDKLRVLKGFLKPLDPVLRAAALCSAEVVRTAHNEAAKTQYSGHPELLDEDGKVRSTLLAEELWMFSVYVPGRNDRAVYELRSLAEAAQPVAFPEPGESWVSAVKGAIMEKIEVFRGHATPFGLYSLYTGVKPALLPSVPRKGHAGQKHGMGHDREYESSDHENWDSRPGKGGEAVRSGMDEDAADKEELKRTRAGHNYDNFFIEMMKLMASRGDLNAVIKGESMIPETSSDDG